MHGWAARDACSATWNWCTNPAFPSEAGKTTEKLDRVGQWHYLPYTYYLLASSPAFKCASPKIIYIIFKSSSHTSKKTQRVSIANNNLLKLFTCTTDVYSENHKKPVNVPSGQNAEIHALNSGGTHRYHWVLNGCTKNGPLKPTGNWKYVYWNRRPPCYI
jgi:hypothetical protein